jgi:ATP-dependent Clp protease protease subunit
MHQPSGGAYGTTTDVRIGAELIMHMKKVLTGLTGLTGLTAEQTGKSIEQITKDADHDYWFTAQEALEYGFIDGVITHAADAGDASQGGKK